MKYVETINDNEKHRFMQLFMNILLMYKWFETYKAI